MLTTEKPSQYLDKSMDFFGKFCSLLKQQTTDTEECIDHPLLKKILSHLIKVSLFLVYIYLDC